MPSKMQKIYQKLALAVLLSLSLVLGACGNPNDTAISRQNNSSITAAVQLSPAVVTIDDPGSPTPAQTEAASPSPPVITALPTATAVVAPTPTNGNLPVLVPVQPSQVAAAANTPQPTISPKLPEPGISPTAKPTPTPTVEPNSQLIDRSLELKTMKTAYDAINKHLFREPDTGGILMAGLREVASVTGATLPVVSFEKNAEVNWNIFTQSFNKMLDSNRSFNYPKYQLAHRVVNVMAATVGDEHTYFLSSSDYQSRQNLLSGDNSSIGFGVLVTTQNEKAYIVRLVAGAPADRVGAMPGDQIVQYDDLAITDKNWTIIRTAKENETHKFTLARTGKSQPVVLEITKKKYTLPTVEYRMINGHIGLIAVRDFFLNVADETDRAMVELRKQGADSWIIDLRENPGGINVEQLVGRFVAGGEIMGYNADRKNRDPMKVSNDLTSGPDKGKPLSPLLPMAVLIDEGSASSSEMFALAAHDFKLGPLIGTKTAGALGHTAAYPLGDGSAISVTVDEYESRDGAKVNGTGVTPDTIIERSIQDLISGRDQQLAAGVEYLDKLLAKK